MASINQGEKERKEETKEWMRLPLCPNDHGHLMNTKSREKAHMYSGPRKSMHILLSNSQAGPGRTVKQEQVEISRNYVQTFSGGPVQSIRGEKW